MHVRITGAGSSVVFLHGAGGSGKVFGNQFQAFRDRFRCYFPDLPGHGKSPGVSDPGIQTYARSVVEFLHTLNVPVTLVGHSMGGAIALELSLTHGELVRAVVLAGTGCRLAVSEETLAGLEADYGATLDKIVRDSFSKSAPPDLVQRARMDLETVAPDIVRADFNSCAAFDVCRRVSTLRLPALIVCGGDDVMTPPGLSEQLHSLIPESQLEIIPDGSHAVMLERREAFNQALLRFLQF